MSWSQSALNAWIAVRQPHAEAGRAGNIREEQMTHAAGTVPAAYVGSGDAASDDGRGLRGSPHPEQNQHDGQAGGRDAEERVPQRPAERGARLR